MCFIMQITQGTAPDLNPPDPPADVCDFCGRLYEFCPCDDHGYLLTGFGRAALHDTPDLRPKVRSAYNQAASNGNSIACTILRGIMPELAEDAETCACCGGDLPDECYCHLDHSPDMNRYGVHD